MAAMEPLCRLIGINNKQLSREENFVLEVEIFTRICEELKEIIKNENRDYFYLFKFDNEK